jgi:hypothetical protein
VALPAHADTKWLAVQAAADRRYAGVGRPSARLCSLRPGKLIQPTWPFSCGCGCLRSRVRKLSCAGGQALCMQTPLSTCVHPAPGSEKREDLLNCVACLSPKKKKKSNRSRRRQRNTRPAATDYGLNGAGFADPGLVSRNARRKMAGLKRMRSLSPLPSSKCELSSSKRERSTVSHKKTKSCKSLADGSPRSRETLDRHCKKKKGTLWNT